MLEKAGGVRIIDEYYHRDKGRTYRLIDTFIGEIIYYTMDADGNTTATWKNISNKDVFWRHIKIDDFDNMLGEKPICTYASKRISFPRDRVKIDCGSDGIYHLAEPKVKDGFVYEINATEHRAFPATKYPKAVFAYTRYNIETIKRLDRHIIERLKTEETIRFNKGNKHSEYVVSELADEVYKYVRSRGDE